MFEKTNERIYDKKKTFVQFPNFSAESLQNLRPGTKDGTEKADHPLFTTGKKEDKVELGNRIWWKLLAVQPGVYESAEWGNKLQAVFIIQNVETGDIVQLSGNMNGVVRDILNKISTFEWEIDTLDITIFYSGNETGDEKRYIKSAVKINGGDSITKVKIDFDTEKTKGTVDSEVNKKWDISRYWSDPRWEKDVELVLNDKFYDVQLLNKVSKMKLVNKIEEVERAIESEVAAVEEEDESMPF